MFQNNHNLHICDMLMTTKRAITKINIRAEAMNRARAKESFEGVGNMFS